MAARGSSPFSCNWLVLRLARQYLEGALTTYARGRLLDIGCGEQPYAPAQTATSQVTGLEYDRQRYAQTPPHIWGSALALPFAQASFDTVFSAQVLEHVPEPGRLIAEAGRILKPGGHLILSAPHIWGLHEEPHDYFRFTSYGLIHLSGQAGLECVRVQAMAGYWVTAGARFCYYLARFERAGLGLLIRPLYALVQLTALGLDRLHRIESDTWNWLLVARKPPVPAP
ncbi:MAG: methyltransferase domain-containing protein [Candidatus Latescibacteria bacterium]|nr:methyltransferase domain-containing protein [Candidatus Latescibacterota bacterium]